MKAVAYRKIGGPEVLELVDDWQLPPRKAGQVLVAVKSTSFNPIDSNVYHGRWNPVLPKVPSGEVAGVVKEVDEGSQFKVGDAVIGLSDSFMGTEPNGAWAEFTFVKEEDLTLAPRNLSLAQEAGAVPLVGYTALQAVAAGKLQPGARVLIHAGAGGVGHVAVQLAKRVHGAYVVSTGRNTAFIKGLGADEVLDYTQEDFAKKYADAPFDAVLDCVGGDTEVKSYDIVKPGGVYVLIANAHTSMERIAAGKQWTEKRYEVVRGKQGPTGALLAELVKLLEAGTVRVHVAEVLPLERAREAEEIAAKKPGGKIVITI